jgi:positive regulator of sigma E activity
MEKLEHLGKTKRVFAIIGMAIGGVIIAAFMALLFGFVVMWLWNWLMPDIFGLKTITFWQAWGLVVLSHILFKSFPHHKEHQHDEHWKKKFREKFNAKTGCDDQPAAADSAEIS